MNYLITGASQGIGYQTALALAADPAHQVLAVSRNATQLAALAAAAHQQHGHANIHVLPLDLADFDPAALLAWVQQYAPTLDGIVNNAGILINKPFAELTDADWMASFSTNVFGAVRLLRTLHPVLVRAHVVNISSMMGSIEKNTWGCCAGYRASKTALNSINKTFAVDCWALLDVDVATSTVGGATSTSASSKKQ